MKTILLSAALLAASYSFAATPASVLDDMEGTWNVKSRACTSNTPINDGIKLGQDKISVTHKADKTFEYKTNIGGCETIVKGTYELDNMKATYNSNSYQGCKDANPSPRNESFSIYIAYLNEDEAVTVATGEQAAMSCPAGDALVVHYTKEDEDCDSP